MSIDIDAVKQAISIFNFNCKELLEIALTHPSKIYENSNLNWQQKKQQEREYRRLAILGDAIFSAIVVDYLHQHCSTLNQGDVTSLKSNLVSRKKAYEFAHKLNLKQLCLLGGSEQGKAETQQQDLLGEMFESLLGAIYLNFERDFSDTRNWLVKHFIADAVHALLASTNLMEQQLPEDCLHTVSVRTPNEAAKLLWQMKSKADVLVAEDEKLQQLLTWINNKCSAVDPTYKPTKVRAFYLALVRLLILGLVRNFDPTRSSAKARQFALSFNRTKDIAYDAALDVAFKRNPNTDPANVIVSVFALEFEPELKLVLQQLQAELPNPKVEREKFEEWRQAKGRIWIEKISKLLNCDLQFTQQEKELLKRYYDANLLLIECLNSATHVSQEVRQEIIDNLLLPFTRNTQ